MKWKKNILSYLLWIIYAGIVLGGIYFASIEVRRMLYLPEMTEYAIAAVCLLLVGLLSVCINQLVHKKKRIAHKKHIIYWMVTLLTGIAGFGIRFYSVSFAFISSLNRPDFFDSARVITGGKMPELYETGYSFYLSFLNRVFFFFGNRQQAASNSQMILWILATILLAAGMCKISGRLASWMSVAGMSFLPIIIQETLTITPGMFNLLTWSIGFIGIIGMAKLQHTKVFAVITGLLIGVLSFVHPTAFLLLIVYFAVRFPYERQQETTKKDKLFCVLGSILATAAGFWGAVLLYCLADGISISHVLSDYGKLYQLKSFQIPEFITGKEFLSIGNLSLFGLAAFGIFNFFYHKKSDYQKPYLILCVFGVFFACTDLPFMMYYSDLFLTVILMLTAAAGLQALFGKREEPVMLEKEDEKKKENAAESNSDDKSEPDKAKKDTEINTEISGIVTVNKNTETGENAETKDEKSKAVNIVQKAPVQNGAVTADLDEMSDNIDSASESYEEIFERYRAASESFEVTEAKQQTDMSETYQKKDTDGTTEGLTADKPQNQTERTETSVEAKEESKALTDARTTADMKANQAEETSGETKDPQVEFLENPLPLPKKHEKKVMDFTVTDMDDDYDIDIPSDDDFDIQ